MWPVMIFFLSPRSSFFRLSIIIIIISQNHHLDLHTHTDGAVHVQSDSTRTVSRLQIHQRYFLSLNAGLFIYFGKTLFGCLFSNTS